MSPAAEDVVIGAAYRALMRHYHPDTNSDPTAQARAREITAAYAVLRDPMKRAEYDAQRADGDLWSQDEDGDGPPRRPPAMRAVGIASAVLALGLVVAVWTLAEKDSITPPTGHSQPAKQATAEGAANAPYPLIQLEPESERLARLREQAEALTPAPVAPPPDETPPPDPVAIPTRMQPALVAPPRAPSLAPRRTAVQVPRQPPPAQSTPKAKVVAAGSVPKNERLATLDTMAGGFFTQSMTHATDAKKELLLGARNRSAAKRKACRSDACLVDAYVRQIRETSAIMEGRTGPPK